MTRARRGAQRRRGRAARARGLAALRARPARLRVLHEPTRDNRIVRFKLGGAVRVDRSPGCARRRSTTAGGSRSGPTASSTRASATTGNTASRRTATSLQRQDPAHEPGRQRAAGNPFPGSRVWSLGPPQRPGARVGPLRAAVGERVRPEHPRRGQPDPRGRNYGWPVVEGRGRHPGGRFTNPLVTWRDVARRRPSGAAIIGSNAVRRRAAGRVRVADPAARRVGGQADAHARRGATGGIRTVVAAPDGTLWVATSNRDGRGSPRSGDDRMASAIEGIGRDG